MIEQIRDKHVAFKKTWSAVNFGAIAIKSWKYSDVSEEEEEYWDFGLKKSVMPFLKLKWIKGLLQTSVIEAKGSLKSYMT